MKQNLLFLIGIAFFTTLKGHSEEFNNKKIKHGDWSVGGGAALSYDTYNGVRASVTPRVQYFIADNLSLGGEVNYTHAQNYDLLGIGPTITYYFMETQNTVLYISQNISYNRIDSDGRYSYTNDALSSRTAIGMNYFINPFIAVGPSLHYNYNTETKGSTALLGNFSIYF